MSASVYEILTKAGIRVVDARVAPRPGSFNPVGVMLHHTANPQPGDLPSLRLLQRGRADLPGPLVQLGAGRAGTIASVCDGRANHAGAGSSAVLARVQHDLPPAAPGADDTTGNGFFIGIEIENAGDHKDPYPGAQHDAVLRVCVALCLHFGWTANRVIGHKEWTRRKPDPSFDVGGFRAELASILHNPQPEPHPQPTPEVIDMDFFILNDANDQTADQWYWWPELGGEKGRKAIVPRGTAIPVAKASRRYCGDLELDRPDLDAIPTLR